MWANAQRDCDLSWTVMELDRYGDGGVYKY